MLYATCVLVLIKITIQFNMNPFLFLIKATTIKKVSELKSLSCKSALIFKISKLLDKNKVQSVYFCLFFTVKAVVIILLLKLPSPTYMSIKLCTERVILYQ